MGERCWRGAKAAPWKYTVAWRERKDAGMNMMLTDAITGLRNSRRGLPGWRNRRNEQASCSDEVRASGQAGVGLLVAHKWICQVWNTHWMGCCIGWRNGRSIQW